MWDWLVLAEASSEGIITSGAFVAALMFIVKWFMKAVDERNTVIKDLAEDSNQALREVARVVQGVDDRMWNVENAIRNSPCGMHLESRRTEAAATTAERNGAE